LHFQTAASAAFTPPLTIRETDPEILTRSERNSLEKGKEKGDQAIVANA
jgi:hypothetical protein